VPFSITWDDYDPDFKITLLIDVEYLRNCNSYNGIITETYACPFKQCNVE